MKERGLATIVIVAVIAVVAVAGVAAYLLLAGSSGGVPIYPGATDFTIEGVTSEEMMEQLTGMSGLPSDWTGDAYQTPDDSTTMMSWYRNQMSGWEKVLDEDLFDMGGVALRALGYTRDTDGALILGMDAMDNYYLMIFTGPAEDMGTIING